MKLYKNDEKQTAWINAGYISDKGKTKGSRVTKKLNVKYDTIKDIPEGEWTKSTVAGQKYINVDKPLKLIEEEEVVTEPAIYGSNGIIIVPSFQKKTGVKIYSVDWEFEEPKEVKCDTADNRPVRAPVAQATKH